jgi:Bacterial PH domain
MPFSASYDRTTLILSGFVCLFLLTAAWAVHSIMVACLSLFVMLLGYAYSPRGYILEGRSILVARLAGTVRIPLDDVREVRRTTPDDFRGCVRLWGSGGLFGYYGLFSTAKLGKSTWYVTSRSHGIVLITGPKTVLLSPDDPDAFLTTIRTAVPIPLSPGAPSFAPSRSFGSLGTIIAVAAALAGVGVAVLATYSPGIPRYTLTPQALTIHDRFYPVTLRAEDVDIHQIRIVDLAQDAEWRPTLRTNGFSNAHYHSGWYRVANGQKVRLYQTDGQRAVLLPPKGDAAPVLYQAADPEDFANQVRAAWSGSAQSN